MKPQNEKIDRIEKALKEVYNKRPEYPVSQEWERNVMARIRALDVVPEQNNIWDAPFIWRTAAAACLSALIILVYSFTNNVSVEFEAARLLLDDPMGASYAQLILP